MSSNLSVQEKFKKKYLTVSFTHCMTHQLNLIVVDMCKYIMVFINFYNLETQIKF